MEITGDLVKNLTDPSVVSICKQLLLETEPDDGKTYCPKVFDHVTCWNYTLANTTAVGGCPLSHPQGMIFSQQGHSYRQCQSDGTWFVNPYTNTSWTNYISCVDLTEYENLQNINYLYESGYLVSFVLLCLAFIIFTCFRQLHCTRVTIHKNLFLSYILYGMTWLLFNHLVTLEVALDSPIWCILLWILKEYFNICNYSWLFVEGFYLHSIIVLTFTNQKKLLLVTLCIGWVLPMFPISIYAIMNAETQDHVGRLNCWAGDVRHNKLLWIIHGTCIASLCVNFIILLNVMRIIVVKIRAVNCGETTQLKKTLRACLILVPLLGVQKVLFPYRQNHIAYRIIVAIVNSYQGACVALLLCYCNREVIKCFKKKISQMKYMNDGRRSSLITIGTSISGFLRRGSRQVNVYTRRTSMSRDRKTSEQMTENGTQTQKEVGQPLLTKSEKRDSQKGESENLFSGAEEHSMTTFTGVRRESIRSSDSNKTRCNLPIISEV